MSNLWRDPAWRVSQHAETIRAILHALLQNDDEIDRWHAANVANLLPVDPETGFDFTRRHLLVEHHPHVATVLLEQLATHRDRQPQAVDDVLAELIQRSPWCDIAATADDADLLDPVGHLTGITLYLALRHQTSAASTLVRTWFSNPLDSPAAASAIGAIRDWLALPDERAAERSRAFALLQSVIHSLPNPHSPDVSDTQKLRSVYRMVEGITSDLYFASGAHSVEEGESVEPIPGFATQAIELLKQLVKFKHPAIVHNIVRTLAHLSPVDPCRTFLVVSRAVKPGDAYTYDALAATVVIDLIERYFAEFRHAVLAEPDLLSAIRSVLHAFVKAGWPAAVSLTYRLSEPFR
ncbi:hypothetical protein AB0G02_10800 [Actinosynnema sp. NPDC023658]|uniref:hypothetical protein n=1 Tax=Actinosynnema sp. NPDC023658 TaxID=3155465 RepID=UPI003404B3C3